MVIESNLFTAPPSENRPHSVGQKRHALHMRMHPYRLSPNDSDDYFRYSVPCDYYIWISERLSAGALALLW
jgi:hypothetical protein